MGILRERTGKGSRGIRMCSEKPKSLLPHNRSAQKTKKIRLRPVNEPVVKRMCQWHREENGDAKSSFHSGLSYSHEDLSLFFLGNSWDTI